MNFKETWAELDKLHEWKPMNPPKAQPVKAPTILTSPEPENIKPKRYRITYYEDGVKKSFIVVADSAYEAEQIGWSKVEADSLYVTEIE